MTDVLREVKAGLRLTLNRADKLNALSFECFGFAGGDRLRQRAC